MPRGLRTLFHAGSLTGVTDGQLLERFALRDGEASESAFAALVERHGTMVWCTCRAVLRDEHEAADAFQATFLVLVRKAGSLWVRDSHRALAPSRRLSRRHPGPARGESTPGRPSNARPSSTRDGPKAGCPTTWPTSFTRRSTACRNGIASSVVLCDLEGRSYEEAARHLRCPVGTVKSRLARARERLRAALRRRGSRAVGRPGGDFEEPGGLLD